MAFNKWLKKCLILIVHTFPQEKLEHLTRILIIFSEQCNELCHGWKVCQSNKERDIT